MARGEKQEQIVASRMKKLAIEPSQLQILDEFRRLPPIAKNDVDGLRERLVYYFNACEEFQIFPSVESLALCIGCDRRNLLKWSADNTSQSGKLITRAKELISAAISQGSMSGSIPFVYGIFQQKANFGYRDKDEPMQELPTNAEDAAAIEDKMEQSGLIWCEEIGDYIVDKGGGE